MDVRQLKTDGIKLVYIPSQSQNQPIACTKDLTFPIVYFATKLSHLALTCKSTQQSLLLVDMLLKVILVL